MSHQGWVGGSKERKKQEHKEQYTFRAIHSSIYLYAYTRKVQNFILCTKQDLTKRVQGEEEQQNLCIHRPPF